MLRKRNNPPPGLKIHALAGIPLVRPGDDLAALLARSLKKSKIVLKAGDVLVVTQKIVSKSEGRIVRLSGVNPSARAKKFAKRLDKDPRKIEVILSESRRVLRAERSARSGLGILICETRHGFVCANAGVDESNLSDPDTVLLLPENSDVSAAKLRHKIKKILGIDLGVIITDTFGRPWRLGLVNVAIGVAGLPAIVDYRGRKDYSGKSLAVTELCLADEIAAVAGLVMGKLEQVPAALVQNLVRAGKPGRAADMIRPAREDLFR